MLLGDEHPENSKWHINRDPSSIDGSSKILAGCPADSDTSYDFALLLSWHLDILTVFLATPNTLGNVDDNDLEITVRFDKAPAKSETWRVGRDYMTLYPLEPARFLEQLANTNVFAFEYRPHRGEPRTVIFNTSGGAEIITELLALEGAARKAAGPSKTTAFNPSTEEQRAEDLKLRASLHATAQNEVLRRIQFPKLARFSTLQEKDDQFSVSKRFDSNLWESRGIVEFVDDSGTRQRKAWRVLSEVTLDNKLGRIRCMEGPGYRVGTPPRERQ